MKTKPQFNFFPKFTFLLLFLLTLNFGFGQTATAPAGAGTSANPYQIATLENLYWIQQNSDHWNKHFIQTSDIDASATSTWFSGGGFPTIAESTNFTGVYNGNGKIILNLYMNRDQSDGCSLFGRVSGSTARIKNLGLVNLNYTFATNQMIGGIVGRLGTGAKVQNCFTTGNLSGTGHIGGIVGSPDGAGVSIEQCWSSVTINSTFTATSARMIGGITGWTTTSITQDCYFSGSISWNGSGVRAGGIAGFLNNNTPTAEISRSYSNGNILGTAGSRKGAVIGEASVNPVATGGVFFDNQLISLNGVGSGTLATGSSVVGRSTSEMKNQSNYPQWDFSTIWGINPNINDGYPYLLQNLPYVQATPCDNFLAEAPTLDNGVYQISTFNHLRWISENSSSWGADFIQTADIDAVITSDNCYNSGEGWFPIGNSITKFNGSYNGDGHTISNLFINRPNGQRIALFGEANGASLQNLGLINADITGETNVGALVGLTDGGTSILSCFASQGVVKGTGNGVGGLVGNAFNQGDIISNSYAIVKVEGGIGSELRSAGFVGINSATLTNCFAAGEVRVNSEEISPGFTQFYSHGLANQNQGSYSNNYFDTETSLHTNSSTGRTGLTTAQMRQQVSFFSWDFQCELSNGAVDIWGIDEGNNYPVLSQFGFVQTCPDNVQVANSTGADGSYFSLADAFIAIDAAGSQAGNSINIILKTNQSIGTSLVVPSGDWSLIRIYPNTAGLRLSGTIDGPLLDFNGSDNIIIEGRVNASGTTKDLIIENLSTGSNASALRFSNGAQNNTVQYAVIRGSSDGSASGVIHFAGSTNGANSGNTIANNDITNANGNRPYNAIYSSGSASPNNNENNTLEANHIFDVIGLFWWSNGIHLAANTTDWIIQANSLFETTPISTSNAGGRTFIRIDNPANGNNFQILNNFIGGSTANAGGVFEFTFNGFGSGVNLSPIIIGTDNNQASLFQNNVVRGISWVNTYNHNFSVTLFSNLLNILSGEVEVRGNSFGTLSGTNGVSLNFTNGSSRGNFAFHAITISSLDTVTVSNNTIAGINATANRPIFLLGINKTNSAGNFTATNNTIGSSSGPIVANGDVAQTLTGILSQGTGLNTISGNTVSYLQRSTTTVGQQVDGINLSGNTNETAIVEKNFVHSLSSSSNTLLSGIRFTGQVDVLNNIVTLTSTSPAEYRGISDFSTATRNVFYNTIFLDGAPSAGTSNNSMAFYNDSQTGNKTYQNNIFENRKSTNGNHFAVRLAGLENTTIAYNNYRSVGSSGGFIGQIGSTDYSDFSSWQNATGQDANSLSIDPQFANAGGTDSANYETSASLPGLPIAGITEDFFSNSRSATTPQMGAYEEPVCAIFSVAPTSGDGLTVSTAYEIASFENLLWITEDPSRWDKFYVQTANIDAGVTKTSEICFGTEGWSPIGNSTTKFTGNYNGGNFEIQNLYINRTDSDYQGLFGWGLNCNINNLSLTGVDIRARHLSGGLLGRLGDNSNSTIAQITNINVSGTINGNNNVTVDTRVGGLIGLSQNAVIDACTSSVIVSASSRSGGLIGENTTFTPGTGGIIKNCTSSGSVSSNGLNIGGLVGYTNIDTKIQNSSSSSNVSALAGAGGLIGYANKSLISNSFAVGNVTVSESNTGYSDAGGLIGYALTFSLIDSCYATGSINGTGRNIGGLIGDFSGSSIVQNSYATGDVVSTGTQGQIGGLIGLYRGAEMSNCYAKGNVTRGGSTSNPGAGGLIGANGGTANASPIVNCYSTGFVSGGGSGSFGGLVGITTNAQSITNSFWDTITSGQSTSDGGTGKTTTEMQEQATFTNWDFQCEAANGTANIWGIDEANDYPRLSWEGFTQDCTVQWTGTVSSDWNTAGNWSNQEGPNIFSIPVITNVANQPTAANNIEVAALQINSGSSLTMQALTSLKVNGNITNNGQILFKSDATGSGQFDEFAGTISGSGNVVIERYIPARRAFRFLSSAITSSGSINANWQEGQNNTSNIPNENSNTNPGYGTHITGSTTGANGFDATPSGNPSLFTLNNVAQQWEAVSNTDINTITAGTPYRILVRGDRSIDVTSNSAAPTPTTIRTTGATTALNTGTFTTTGFNETAGAFNFFGNPYPAAVDMNQVLSAATNINQVTYWVWDPTLGGIPTPGTAGGRGGYVAVNVNDNTSNNGSSNANRYLQPGQAAFVQTAADGSGSTTMSFQEGYKAVSQPQTQVFNVVSTIRMKLYDAFSFANGGTSSDGLLLKFSEEGSNQVTFEDAMKFYNQDENLASVNGETLLSIESRAWPEVGETIPLFNNQYRKTSYVFEIELNEMNALEVLLKDHFTGTTAELQNNTNTLYTFEVDATIPSSIANDRFEIVFEEETLSSDTPLFGEEFILYPNPTSSTFYIATRGIQGDEVRLTVRSITGQKVFTNTMTVPSNGQLQVELPGLSSGMYLVELTHPIGGIFTSKLIKK